MPATKREGGTAREQAGHFHHDPSAVLCVVTNGELPDRSLELLRALKIDATWWDGNRFVAAGQLSSSALRELASP
jgi:hypothetical protein